MNVRTLKPHYEVLDGLRGTAALTVVIFHLCEFIYPDYHTSPFGHGFLAVDFFFCLSGFVIGYAYDDRPMGLKFVKSRLIRLHPLVILGTVLGLLAFLFDPFGNSVDKASWDNIVLTFICSMLLIPSPGLPDRYGNLMPLNAPAWSLFSEYVANIVYALILWRLPRRALIPLAIITAAALIYTGVKADSLVGGWSADTMRDGFARVFFSFTIGLLVHRYRLILKTPLGYIALSVLLLAAFMLHYNVLGEILVVMFGFPLILSLGAGATVSPRMRPFCTFMGRISYPLYMTHYMVMWSFCNFYGKHPLTGLPLMAVLVSIVAVLVSFAYLVMKFYDEPVRKYLSRKFVS